MEYISDQTKFLPYPSPQPTFQALPQLFYILKINFPSYLTLTFTNRVVLFHFPLKNLTVFIVIRYKVYSEQHARAGLNIQHVIYEQLARAGRNT